MRLTSKTKQIIYNFKIYKIKLTNSKLAFKVNEAYEAAKKRGGALYERLGKDLFAVLNEAAEDMKNKFLSSFI